VVQVVAFAAGGVVLAKLIKTASPVLARTAISTV